MPGRLPQYRLSLAIFGQGTLIVKYGPAAADVPLHARQMLLKVRRQPVLPLVMLPFPSRTA